jgi:hypothetical protein
MSSKGVIGNFLGDLGFTSWNLNWSFISWFTIIFILIIFFSFKCWLLMSEIGFSNYSWNWLWFLLVLILILIFFLFFFLWLWCWDSWTLWLSS